MPSETHTPTLSDYRNWLAGDDMSPNTIKQRLDFAAARLLDWGTFDQPAHVVVPWLQHHRGWTHRTYVGHLRSLYAWLIETGQLDHDPTARVRRASAPRMRPNPISAAQLGAALDTADPRLRAWIMLGALAGMRCHEIAQISGEDVTDHGLLIHGKGGVEAIVPTHPDLWTLAQDYPRTGWWFPSPHRNRTHIGSSLVGNTIREHFRTVGIETGAAHRLRHTYCTNLSRAGVRPRVVQELMRHRSLETTMGYDAVDEDERQTAIRLLTLPGEPAA